MSSPTYKPRAWTRTGTARVVGSGIWITTTSGETFGISAEDFAAFFFDGEPATVYRIDPTGTDEPRPAGTMDLSQSGRMAMVMIDGAEFTALQLPSADLAAHYRRADRRGVPCMAPPVLSSCMAVPA